MGQCLHPADVFLDFQSVAICYKPPIDKSIELIVAHELLTVYFREAAVRRQILPHISLELHSINFIAFVSFFRNCTIQIIVEQRKLPSLNSFSFSCCLCLSIL